ncbi:DUF4258 domain-containing protein [Paraflavitalea sp. CAU 1676]|uniref:DUF4258 domain-containing protein n=1 Tax=Paraflavitalea sp. CAU 1676 TaxID=3032598 RepID=UPI0023DA2267|nr:DUF4258 domain-containing protein [Paraflavitalea sp. CAU 1676]MDF2188799.1 DUF4258 domain-containing protein [Paraflavitalea sp. CAU 1676]
MNKSRRPISIALVVIIIVLGIVLRNNRSRHKDRQDPRQEQTNDRREPEKDRPQPAGPNDHRPQPTKPPSDEANRNGGFDRRHGDGKLIYTKHARCRMACRHIDESEVEEILQTGSINERKSEPAARPDPKYALEGRTHDGQQVRIIFATASRGMVVVTVIDLDTDWTCDCR